MPAIAGDDDGGAGFTVLHIASEMTPLIKSGGLADVVGSPKALRDLDCDARIAIPGVSSSTCRCRYCRFAGLSRRF